MIIDTGTFLASAGLGVTFGVVGLWQRRLEKERDRENLEKLHQAKARGADRPFAQHPQIREDLCIGCGSCVAACPENGVLGLIRGTSKVILASKCVGHGRCQEVCPTGGLTVSLGDVSARPDIPVLSETFESSIPGLYIAGELGGFSLVRNAIDQGRRVVDDVARRLRSGPAAKSPGVRDLLIVGAGPAGLSATFRAVELGLDCATVSLDGVGGTVRKYPRRKLTLVQAVEIPLHGRLEKDEYLKEDLLALWSGLVQKHGVTIQTGAGLQSVTPGPGYLETQTSAGAFRSRFVLLALGRRGSPRKLGVPGEDSERVLYELADAAALTGQRILVVGGGDSAVEAAVGLAAQPGNQVTLSYRKPGFVRLKTRNEERLRDAVARKELSVELSSELRAIDEGAVILDSCGVGGAGEMLLPNDWVFVFAGGEPPFPLLHQIGVRFGKAPSSTGIPAGSF